ncbi:MAG: TrmH family RNA methyltransferase [Acidimicrobiia bacterium]
MANPRHRYLTIYGRLPVIEALEDTAVPVARVFVADSARGDRLDHLLAAARRRGVTIERVAESRVAALARNGRQHQGVAADIAPPGLGPLDVWLPERRGRRHATTALLLDGVHNPANVGMIIRAAVGAGLDGIIVPRRGTAELGPLVLKASAGVALRATLLRTDSAEDAATALLDARFDVIGLDGGHPDAEPLFGPDAPALPERAVYVLGNESDGISEPVGRLLGRRLAIPLAGGVESLNVATAAAVLVFELARRRLSAVRSG